MKKITIISWIIVMVAVSLISTWGMFGYSKLKDKSLNSCEKFVDDAVKAICSNWDYYELIERANPDKLHESNEQTVEKMFVFFRKLGKMNTYHGCEGKLITVDGKTHFLYIAEADFNKGPAKIIMELSKEGKKLYIDDFKVKSEEVFGEYVH
jgi:hypothetical protein